MVNDMTVHKQNILLRKNKTFKKGGFSAMEIIITLFIITVVGLALINFQLDISSLNKISNDSLLAQEDLRKVLKTMSAEIRSMAPSNMGAYAIAQAGTSSLIFYSDIDSDTLQEKIHYFLDGTTLIKNTVKPAGSPLNYNSPPETKQLAHDINNGDQSVFDYYNTNYDGTSPSLSQPVNISDIRLIKVQITIDKDINKSPEPVSMTTQISIRNIKDNL